MAADSADVWAEPQFFQLDKSGHPTEVAGVPPDHFSEDGQLWGNPLYNYDALRADGFGWLNTAPAAVLNYTIRYLGLAEEEGLHWGILRGGMTSVCNLFIAPIQDYLGLDSSARINTPATAQGNWQWRLLPGEPTSELAERIAALTRLSGRI